MSDYEPTSPREAHASDTESSKTSGPTAVADSGAATTASSHLPASSRHWLLSSNMTGQRSWPRMRGHLPHMRQGLVVAAALVGSVTGLIVGVGASSAGAAQSATAGTPGHFGSSGQGSNARSGPAAGGSTGTVGNVAKSSFTLTTSAGQEVTVDEQSSTKYEKGTHSAAGSAVTKGEHVLVLGTVDSTTIKATEIIVQTSGGEAQSTTAAAVVPFQKGAAQTSKQAGQVPASYTEGSGTIVSGIAANKATEAALAAYPGGTVDRVVKLSNGEYEVHNIGVNWPHHVFVNQDFKVVGAD